MYPRKLLPACLTRWQYWARLIMLVPFLISLKLLSLIGAAIGSGANLSPLVALVFLAIVSVVMARLRYVGIGWLSGLGLVAGILAILGPFLVFAVFLAIEKVYGIGLMTGPAGSLNFAMASGLSQMPLMVVALIAGIIKGDPERHLRELAGRAARSPKRARFYLERGRFLGALERDDEALAAFNMALKLEPGMKAALQEKASMVD